MKATAVVAFLNNTLRALEGINGVTIISDTVVMVSFDDGRNETFDNVRSFHLCYIHNAENKTLGFSALQPAKQEISAPKQDVCACGGVFGMHKVGCLATITGGGDL